MAERIVLTYPEVVTTNFKPLFLEYERIVEFLLFFYEHLCTVHFRISNASLIQSVIEKFHLGGGDIIFILS